MVHVSSLGAKALAVSLSVSAHVAVALVAAQQGLAAPMPHAPPESPLIELAAPDLEPTRVPAPDTRPANLVAQAPRPPIHHTHLHPVPANHDAIPHDPSLSHVSELRSEAHEAAPAPAPSAIEATSAATPRFVLTMGAAARAQGGAISPEGARGAPGSIDVAAPLPESAADVPARLYAGDPPSYTAAAEAAGIEAEVPLEIVVDANGAVTAARSSARVGYGLEEAAMRAIRAYRFTPARRDGRPTPVRMRWVMRFQLR